MTKDTDRLNVIERLIPALALQDKKLEDCLAHLEELVNQLRKDDFIKNNGSRFSLVKSLSAATQNNSVLRSKTSQ